MNRVESAARLEVDRLKNQLSHEETAAVVLRSEAAEARNESHGAPDSSGMAEEQSEMMKRNMSWVESVTQKQYDALQQQFESLQQFNQRLHEKSLDKVKSDFFWLGNARDGKKMRPGNH